MTVDGEGSSGNGEKQAQSDKGSMMGWEVTTAHASLDNSPNGLVDVVDKNKGTDNAISFVGQHAHVEKEMMEVSSPIKPKAGPTNIRTISDDKLSPTGEGNGKVKCQSKNRAREKGKKYMVN